MFAVSGLPAQRRAAVILAALIGTSLRAQNVTPASVTPASGGGITIDRVLRSAMTRHPLVEAADARLRAARGARGTARAFPNPIFTYQVENVPLPGRAVPVGLERETQAFGTLPLEPLWQRWSRVGRANEDVRAAVAELELARRAVGLDAARAFYRVALAQVTLRGARDIREGLDSLERFNRARVKEGVAAEGDLIRIEVETARARTDVALAQVELVRARADLLPFLDDTIRTTTALASLSVAESDSVALEPQLPPLASLMPHALDARPDVLAARARARAASKEVQYQRTLFVRQLGATFGQKSAGGVTSMIAGFSIPVPLFDQNRGEMQRAGGERTAAERELAWTERRASAEVAGAYEAARVLAEQASQLQQGFLARAEEARHIAVAAYQEGAASLLQVIDATRTLADARLTYYHALFAHHEGLLDLFNAAGMDLLAAPTSISGTTR